MDEVGFDRLLRLSAPAPSASADHTAVMLARQLTVLSQGGAPVDRRRPRRRWVVAAAAAAVVSLTGAAAVTAYQLNVPPFQTLELGKERARTAIPVTYMNSLGREVECLAFIEYRNLNEEQKALIEDVSQDERWNGEGQRLLDESGLRDAAPIAQNEAVFEALQQDLRAAAHEVVPEMVIDQPDSQGPVFAGSSMSCANPGGVDGRP